MDNDKQILAKINQRERQILVHAYLYYKNNRNLVSDDKYDQWSFELADLIKKAWRSVREVSLSGSV